MAEQNYSNHTRYYTPHHVVFYSWMLGMIAYAGCTAYIHPEQRTIWIFLLVLVVAVTFLSFMLRQHYALTLQNRIVRVEMRARYQALTGQSFDGVEQKLSFGQIAALRFASDAELAELTQRAMHESMSPDSIKRAIQHWRPDHLRV